MRVCVCVLLNSISLELQNIPLPWICIIMSEQQILRHSLVIILENIVSETILCILLIGAAARYLSNYNWIQQSLRVNFVFHKLGLSHIDWLHVFDFDLRFTHLWLYQPSLRCNFCCLHFFLMEFNFFSLFISFNAIMTCVCFSHSPFAKPHNSKEQAWSSMILMNRVAIMISSLFFRFLRKMFAATFSSYIHLAKNWERVCCVRICDINENEPLRLDFKSDFIFSSFLNSFNNFQAFTFWNLWKPVASVKMRSEELIEWITYI